MHKHELPPLSLYIHIPWCVKKCPYCDFNSHKQTGDLPEEQYIEQLIRDFEKDKNLLQNHSIQSIFFGGGTPSLLSVASIEKLLIYLNKNTSLTADCEITLEANPGTVDEKKFAGFCKAGINRLSIGIQSFSNQSLIDLGRIHDGKQALSAYEIARKAGFNNINLDLMFGLPNQSIASALHDLKQAINLDPEHISWYQLTIETNTYFYKFPPPLPEDDLLWTMQTEGQKLLKHSGYHQYEISAYAKTNLQCRHNINYWTFGDYLGIGAGAHSKITQNDNIIRQWKYKQPNDYLDPEKSFTAGKSIIPEKDLPLEFLLNTLRLIDGVDYALFEKRTGLPLHIIEKSIANAEQKQLLCKNRLQATPQGLQFLNDLLQLFQ